MPDSVTLSPPASGEIVPFNFGSIRVRVVTDANGEPWFVATDICRVLELAKVESALRVLDDDEKGAHTVSTLGGAQELSTVAEPGLYKLLARSRKPEARKFDRWVRHEVLPAIRRTGSYGVAPRDPIEVLNDPAAMRGLLLTYSEKVLALEMRNAELTPKADALDRIATADGLMNITAAAKTLQVEPNKLFKYLDGNRWTYKRAGSNERLAYQDKIQAGLLEHKLTTMSVGGVERVRTQVFVTAKGIAKLSAIFTSPQLPLH